MRLTINGEIRDVANDTTVDRVVATVTAADTGCAVALNGEVVPRHDWADRRVTDGDDIEILTAVQGG